MKDAISLIRSYQTYNFIKNLKGKINNADTTKINSEYLKAIENSFSSEEILNEITVALLNYIWPTEQDFKRKLLLKKFIKHVLKFSNTTVSIYISALYYLLNLKDNQKFNNLLQRIQLEIENTKQEQGFVNNGNLQERCCNCCGAYISCYRSETVVCKCRLFLMSLVLACKFGQDKNYSNKAWSKISQFTVANINYNERFFLNLIDYKLYINLESFKAFATMIANHIIKIKNQKQKLHCKELMNLTKLSMIDAVNVNEWKKNLEKKSMLTKKIKELEAVNNIKKKQLNFSLQTKNIEPIPYSQPIIQKYSPFEVNNNHNSNAVNHGIQNSIQKLSPLENQYVGVAVAEQLKFNTVSGTSYRTTSGSATSATTTTTNSNINVAAISPISPNGLPMTTIHGNVNIPANANAKTNANVNANLNFIKAHHQNLLNQSHQNNMMGQTSDKKEQLTVEVFSSFIKFYNCINSKLSTSPESIIKATSSYKILNCALNLAYNRRIQDALNVLNHVIYGTMDICKEILSLAIKGQKKNALVYIYLLTPSEIQFYNSNIKSPNLKSLTPKDVLSVVSILINCVQKKSNSTSTTTTTTTTSSYKVKNDLLANLGQYNQINSSISANSQNLILKFIQNINYNLTHN